MTTVDPTVQACPLCESGHALVAGCCMLEQPHHDSPAGPIPCRRLEPEAPAPPSSGGHDFNASDLAPALCRLCGLTREQHAQLAAEQADAKPHDVQTAAAPNGNGEAAPAAGPGPGRCDACGVAVPREAIKLTPEGKKVHMVRPTRMGPEPKPGKVDMRPVAYQACGPVITGWIYVVCADVMAPPPAPGMPPSRLPVWKWFNCDGPILAEGTIRQLLEALSREYQLRDEKGGILLERAPLVLTNLLFLGKV